MNGGMLQIYFPDDVTGQEFEELIRQARDEGGNFMNNPMFQRVKKAMLKTRENNGAAKGTKMDIKDLLMGNEDSSSSTSSSSAIMDIKGGESIREILDKTLGRLPCLTKNLGW